LKLSVVVTFGALVVLITLGTVFGVDMSPENALEILSNATAELIKFLTKFLEGLG